MGKFLAEIVELYPAVYAIHKLILCGKAKIIIKTKGDFSTWLHRKKLCQAAIFGHTEENPFPVQVAEFAKLYETVYIYSLKFLNLAHSGLKT